MSLYSFMVDQTQLVQQTNLMIESKQINRTSSHLMSPAMGNVEKTYNTRQYQFTLRTDSGKKVSVTAFGMDRITGPVAKVNTLALAKLFPSYGPELPQRKPNQVDILLGHDYFG